MNLGVYWQNSKNTKLFINSHLKNKDFHMIMVKTLKVL